MARRKQKSTMALLMDIFMDAPLVAAEAALELAQELVARRQVSEAEPSAKPARQRRQVAAPPAMPVVAEPASTVAATATPAPKPVGVRRRIVAGPAAVGATTLVAPRKRGRPFGKKVAAEPQAVPAEVPVVQMTPTLRDLPDQVTPDDSDVVEG
jgi:hypothetical protein